MKLRVSEKLCKVTLMVGRTFSHWDSPVGWFKSKQEIKFLVRIVIYEPVLNMKNGKLINNLDDEANRFMYAAPHQSTTPFFFIL